MRINVELTPAVALVCCQAVLNFLLHDNQCVAQLLHLLWGAARLFPVLLNENQRVAQLLHLFWCPDMLFPVLVNGNERVAPLLHLFWCAARQFLSVVK